MAKEFIVYSKTKAEFEALVSSGEVDTSQMGIIAKTGEMWWNGEYRPIAETVPFANDLTGRIEATPEEFTLRPSAGDKSIRDESALIKRIKGNTIVWNQIVKNGNFVSDTDWAPYRSNYVSVNWDNGLTVTSNYSGSNTDGVSMRQKMDVCVIIGHKYLSHIEFSSSNSSLFPLLECYPVLHNDISRIDYMRDGNHYFCINNTRPDATAPLQYYYLYLKARGVKSVGDTWTFKKVEFFDLTQMFGAGNEPTTVEEFKALFPNAYYDYNDGELVSMTSNGLFANGFNQFNGEYAEVLSNNTYYLGGTYTTVGFTEEIGGTLEDITIPTDKLYTPTKKGYIYATGTNICINLSHTGVRNGEYEPYWDATKDLSIIQKYFPDGMRSAGSIYDEISFDEATQKWVAIQRVGSVDLGSLAWSISGLLYTSDLENLAKRVQNSDIANILCTKYTTIARKDVSTDNIGIGITSAGILFVNDSSYTNTPSFKSAMSGVMLYYELAEPVITTIEEPIDLSYKVGDFGIEKMLSDSFSAPFKADIIYQFNATDRVRENSMNISKLNKKHNLLEREVDALESKALTTDAQTLTADQKAQVATNLGGNTNNGLVRYVGGVLPLKKISAPDANGVEQTYVLPNASDEDKGSASGVIATEDFVDDGYIPRPSGTSASKANKLLAYSDGRTYDSGVGISQDVSDIANSATDSVPTSAIVKEYVDGQQPTEGDGISIRGKYISVKSTNAFSFKNGQLDLSENTKNSIKKGVDAKTAIDALRNVVRPSISGGVRVLDITVTSGLIDDDQLVYALPSAPEESLGDADAVLATEGYVANYMNSNLPTAVATATTRVLTWPATNSIQANTIYDISRSTTTALTIYSFVGGSGTTYAFDDVWRVRFAGVSSALSVVPIVYWENGIAPNFLEWAICDLEFRRLPNDEYIGKWEIYR